MKLIEWGETEEAWGSIRATLPRHMQFKTLGRMRLAMGFLVILTVLLLAPARGLSVPYETKAARIDMPEVVLRGVPFVIEIHAIPAQAPIDVTVRAADGLVLARSRTTPGETAKLGPVVVTQRGQHPLSVQAGDQTIRLLSPLLPGWFSLMPPLIAIALALLCREVVPSLFAGIWLGCLALADYRPLAATLMTIDRYARGALMDSDHVSIVLFSLLLGGMVGMMTRMGAMPAMIDVIAPLTKTRRRGQLAAWLAGLAIFFDDYSNTLIVGNTMRPLTDRLLVSREKLAYIVDSTAAPLAAIAFISTWIGFEISLIQDALTHVQARGTATPFGIFFHSIPYLFYPIFALLLVVILIVMQRDFGPMLAAERRAASGNGVYRQGSHPLAPQGEVGEGEVKIGWWGMAIPVSTVIITVLVGLIHTGRQRLPQGLEPSLAQIFGHADAFTPLLWGGLLGCLVAAVLGFASRRLTLSDMMIAWLDGLRTMMVAMVTLVLAWSLAGVTESLGTASFLASTLSSRLAIEALPASVFCLSALISFATGTAWGTMAILFPLVISFAL